MIVAAAFFFVWMIIPMPALVAWVLLGLPALFFVFSFVDLRKSMKSKLPAKARSHRITLTFLALVLLFQLFVPITPVNFIWRNRPSLAIQPDNGLSPVINEGDLTVTNPLAYSVNLFFFDQPVWRTLPDIGDPVQISTADGQRRNVFVVGRPHDEVQIAGSHLTINGIPFSLGLAGAKLPPDYPLTRVKINSILVLDYTRRGPHNLTMVPLSNVTGKIHSLF